MVKMKRVMSLLISTVLLAGSLPQVAHAETALEKQRSCGYIVLPEEQNPEEITGRVQSKARSMAFWYAAQPTYRTKKLPAARDQGQYNTCWSFATLGLEEIRQANLPEWEQVANAQNLSELHLSYFYYHTPIDPLGGLEGDRNYIDSDSLEDSLNYGGSTVLAMQVLANWTGAAKEEVMPYAQADTLSGENADTIATKAYEDVLHLKNGYSFSMKTGDDTTTLKNRNIAKEMIANYGAIAISFYAATNVDELSRAYNADTNGYYTWDGQTANHAVDIVGWDDNYSLDNFNAENGEKPKTDGAWLVRNSWGSDKEEYEGYFWLSYWDKSITGTAYALEFEDADSYDNNYQYDGGMKSGSDTKQKNSVTAANVFEAKSGASEEDLKAVSFRTSNTQLSYKIEIYTNLTEASNPTSGTKIEEATTTGNTVYTGYYTIPLKQTVRLKTGTSYAVVVTLQAKGKNVNISSEMEADGGYKVEVSAKENQSFLFINNRWIDYGKTYDRNIRIKAFTKNVEEPEVISGITYNLDGGENAAENPNTYSDKGETITLKAPTKTGYTFMGWYTDESYRQPITEIPQGSKQEYILYARFVPITYTIQFDGNGGVGQQMEQASIFYDRTYRIPAASYSREDYLFAGWNTRKDGKGTSYGVGETVTNLFEEEGKTLTLYAQWKEKPVEVWAITYNLGGGSNHEENPASYDSTDGTIVLKAPSRVGYQFEGWYGDLLYANRVTELSTQNQENYILYAKWSANSYQIAFDGNGAEDGAVETIDARYDTTDMVPVNAYTREGFDFVSWNTRADGSGIRFESGAELRNLSIREGDVVLLYAQWVERPAVESTITYHLDGGVNAPANPVSYNDKEGDLMLAEAQKTGYQFEGWYLDSGFHTKITKIPAGSTQNYQLYAKWSVNCYTVILDGNGADSSKMKSLAESYEKVFQIPENSYTRAGYIFRGWNTSADGGGTAYQEGQSVKNLRIENGDNIVLYAQWLEESAVISDVSYVLEGGDNNQENPIVYTNKDGAIPLKTPTKKGYTFEGWYRDSSFRRRVVEIPAGSSEDYVLYAKWSANKYTIRFDGNGAVKGNMVKQTCRYDQTYSLRAGAFTRRKYVFAGWNTKVNGKGIAYKNQAKIRNLTAVADKNITLYAQWTKVSVERNELTTLKNTADRNLVVKYSKVNKCRGYEIQYALNASFTGKRWAQTTKQSYTLTRLTKGKNYYVRVRGYKLDSMGEKVYGSWSVIKKIKIAK